MCWKYDENKKICLSVIRCFTVLNKKKILKNNLHLNYLLYNDFCCNTSI